MGEEGKRRVSIYINFSDYRKACGSLGQNPYIY